MDINNMAQYVYKTLAIQTRPGNETHFKKQQGSVLPVSLFILLVLTIIGATSLNDTVMEEKMASNFQNSNIAFQAAESSVNRALSLLDNNLILSAEMAQETANRTGNNPQWPTTTPYTMDRFVADPNSEIPQAHSSTDLNSTIRYVGTDLMPAAGCSIVERGNSCMGKVVEIVGTGTITGSTVSRTHLQGVEKIVPGS